ncbi:MAG: hypothetical protein KKI14_00705, partial [Nanoarchaeota archaeon]|nr:hypothetical protein [Nanoarchaeota archaeon]
YGQEVKTNKAKIEVYNAGHVPGSAIYIINIDGKRILYTSDFNTQDSRLLKGANVKDFKNIDVLIIESTYASKEHPDRAQTEKELYRMVSETVENGGIALIPAFAVGRSAEVLMALNAFKPKFKIYMDGMARAATEIYLKYPELLRNKKDFNSALNKVDMITNNEQRREVMKEPCAIITTGGCCVHPDTYIQTATGEITKAIDTNTSFISLDMKNFTQQSAISTKKWKKISPEMLYLVRTRTNNIKMTGDHELFALDDQLNIISKKCSDLKKDDYFLNAKKIEFVGKSQPLDNKIINSKIAKKIRLPNKTTPDFCQFLGYLIGDGNLHQKKKIRLTDKDIQLLKFYKHLGENIFGLAGKIKIGSRKRLTFYSVMLYRFLEKMDIHKGRNRIIPEFIHKCPENELASFLRGLFDAEGTVGADNNRSIALSSHSKNIINITHMLLLRFGILSSVNITHKRIKNKVFEGYILSIQNPDSIRKYKKYINFSSRKKKDKLEKLSNIIKDGWNHFDIVPVKKYALYNELKKYYKKIPKSRMFHIHKSCDEYITKSQLIKFIKFFDRKNKELDKFINKLKILTNNNIFWNKILEKTEFQSDTEFVYDFTIPGYSNYIANGLLTHNCDGGPAIQYIRNLWSNNKNSLTFVGFQIPKTAGRYLLDTGRFVNEETDLKLKMQVNSLDFSAHADRNDLFKFINKIQPEKVVCMHGDNCQRFAQELRSRGFNAIAPKNGETVDTNRWKE